MGTRVSDVRHRVIQVPSPAAGANLAIPVPGEFYWVVRHFTFQLVTSAVVAARQVVVTADDGLSLFFASPVNNTQAATATVRYVAFPGSQKGSLQAGIDAFFWPIDSLILPPGSHLNTAISLIDVGDQISSVVLFVTEYETGPFAAAVPIPPFYVPQLDPAYAG